MVQCCTEAGSATSATRRFSSGRGDGPQLRGPGDADDRHGRRCRPPPARCGARARPTVSVSATRPARAARPASPWPRARRRAGIRPAGRAAARAGPRATQGNSQMNGSLNRLDCENGTSSANAASAPASGCAKRDPTATPTAPAAITSSTPAASAARPGVPMPPRSSSTAAVPPISTRLAGTAPSQADQLGQGPRAGCGREAAVQLGHAVPAGPPGRQLGGDQHGQAQDQLPVADPPGGGPPARLRRPDADPYTTAAPATSPASTSRLRASSPASTTARLATVRAAGLGPPVTPGRARQRRRGRRPRRRGGPASGGGHRAPAAWDSSR